MDNIRGKKWSGIADFADTGAAEGDDFVAVNNRADDAGEIVLLRERSQGAGEIARRLRGYGHEREEKRYKRREAHGREVYRLAAERTRIRRPKSALSIGEFSQGE